MSRPVMVMQAIRKGETVTASVVMERTGLPRSAAGQILNFLWNAQQLERVERGVFQLNPSRPPLVGHRYAGNPHGRQPVVFQVEHANA